MGFCLLEQAGEAGVYFAVNAAHVAEIVPQGEKGKCLLKMSGLVPDFEPLAVGSKDEIQSLLLKTAKIGFRPVNIHILGGTRGKRPQPFLMNNTDRIMLVHEVFPEEFGEGSEGFMTASRLYIKKENPRLIVERPGVLARLANAGEEVLRL